MKKLHTLEAVALGMLPKYDVLALHVSKHGGIPYPVQLSTGKCRKKRTNKLHRSRMLKRKHARK